MDSIFGTYQKSGSDANYQVQYCTRIGQTGFLLGEQLPPFGFGNLFIQGHDTRNRQVTLLANILQIFSRESLFTQLIKLSFLLDRSWYSNRYQVLGPSIRTGIRSKWPNYLPVARCFHFIGLTIRIIIFFPSGTVVSNNQEAAQSSRL